MAIVRYAIDFEMSNGTTKTVEFEVPEGSMEGYLHTDGRRGMAADLKMLEHRIREVADPVENGDAVNLAYTKKVGNPHNLLDNSDFRNPVNQRGLTSYVTGGFSIDRWVKSHNTTVTVNDGYVACAGSNILFVQRFEKVLNGLYTAACKLIDGTTHVITGAMSKTEIADGVIAFGINEDGLSYVKLTTDIGIVWAALYEGEYTAETLPEYQPKGYGVELAECLRYFYRFDSDKNGTSLTFTPGISTVAGFLFPVPMRVVPTMTVTSIKTWTRNGFADVTNSVSSKACTTAGLKYIDLLSAIATEGGVLYLTADFSADL